MSIPFRPIVSALLRNRTGALLVALQIAIALAVLVNAVYIVKQRVDKIGRPTGMDDAEHLRRREHRLRAGLRLRRPRCARTWPTCAACPASSRRRRSTHVPLSRRRQRDEYSTPCRRAPANGQNGNYFADRRAGASTTLGVKLIAGRDFRGRGDPAAPSNTVQSYCAPQIIMTKALADALFPKGDALGQDRLRRDDEPTTIIGIIDNMLGSWVALGPARLRRASLPRFPNGPDVRYLVRTAARAGATRSCAPSRSTSSQSNPDRAINWVRPLELLQEQQLPRATGTWAIFLVSVTALLLAITSLGIFGLATFNVSTRTKQIGTRRAVGARRRDIVRYFLVENWMITTAGVAPRLRHGARRWATGSRVEYRAAAARPLLPRRRRAACCGPSASPRPGSRRGVRRRSRPRWRRRTADA